MVRKDTGFGGFLPENTLGRQQFKYTKMFVGMLIYERYMDLSIIYIIVSFVTELYDIT